MKKQVNKLNLNKCTVANISAVAIEDVKGGTGPWCVYSAIVSIGFLIGVLATVRERC